MSSSYKLHTGNVCKFVELVKHKNLLIQVILLKSKKKVILMREILYMNFVYGCLFI